MWSYGKALTELTLDDLIQMSNDSSRADGVSCVPGDARVGGASRAAMLRQPLCALSDPLPGTSPGGRRTGTGASDPPCRGNGSRVTSTCQGRRIARLGVVSDSTQADLFQLVLGFLAGVLLLLKLPRFDEAWWSRAGVRGWLL
jgi:hypothetical protein